jgi:exodeoxyribonuclease VII large subunit
VKLGPDARQVTAAVASLGTRLQTSLARRFELSRDRLTSLARSRMFADPSRLVRDRRDAIDRHAIRLLRLAGVVVERTGERVAAAAARLEAGSPVHLLARGWSVTRLEGHDAALKSTAGIAAGATLITQLTDGRLWSRVDRTTHDAIGR